ncbi:signal transduction histidine kinase [Leptolyngbya sp. Heron Island J]|uniref:sensor histidine kinase n=1 Tax=Leptolyngbya sp. Heron Island J TaxID=1385935 RepID=UPI0003B9951A|nr:sensor histidine kinase [Leptolyngbya sp. Heron Island J]ESA38597.1 signal transduction histidine kinase [Leptolyngbya sp. Heron Island J]
MSAQATPQISTINPSIPKILRYVEWAFLVMVTLRVLFPILHDSVPYEIGVGDYLNFCVLAVLAALSFVFPIRRPLWQRQSYIFIEIFCLLLTRAFSDWGLDLLLFLYLAKSSFLLRRRDVIVTAIWAGIAWHVGLVWRLMQNVSTPIEQIQARVQIHLDALQAAPQLMVIDAVFNNLVIYVPFSVLIILLCLTLVAEYKSRQQAVALSQEVELLAADLERSRIARDIHDSLGHTLISLDVQLELAQRLYNQDSEKVQQALNTSKLLASQSVREVRRAVTTMREETFDLNLALMQLLESFDSEPSLTVKGNINLPQLALQTNHQLYCMIKEGLENIRKHSQARVIELQGKASAEMVTIRLEDDGIGFDLAKPTYGFGLRGMHERAQLVGGSMRVDSRLGQGTCIQIRIPR